MDFTERVRDAASIEQLVGELTELKANGTRRVGLCPFHQEDSPSFVVYPSQQSWHCFGCGRGGSAFDLVMVERSLDVWESVQYLAGRYNIPLPDFSAEEKAQRIQEETVADFLALYVEKSHDKLLKSTQALDYLHERGVTDESISEYRIGLGIRLAEPIEGSGLVVDGTNGRWQPMAGRLLFPVFAHGKPVQISGRALNDKPPKYLSLPGRTLYPWQAHRLRSDRCFLVEGVLDAILLSQAGFPAVAVIGKELKSDWLKLFGKQTTCYVAFDGDDAGRSANQTVGDKLHDAGRRTLVVELPPAHDPASFIQSEGAGAYQALVDSARGYVDWLINRLSPSLSPEAISTAVESIFAKLGNLSESAQGRYLDQLAKHLKLTKQGLRNDLKDFQRKQKARAETEQAGSDLEILRREVNPIRFNPAQDVIGGTLYYTVHIQIQSRAFLPFVITSNHECFLLTRDNILERDFYMDPSAEPFDDGRWSIGTSDPYNVYDWIDGKVHVDAQALFHDVRGYFERFLRLPDPFYYDFLSLWCMATYHFRLYDSFGYIFLNAIKGSGKTQALTIMSWLAFNATHADAITEASLKRLVNANSAVLLNDEAERLRKKFEDDQSTLFEVWNGGYKKSGKAISVNKETMQVERFCTYSPKALANIRGLENVLEDRCITLYFLRDLGKIPELVEGEQARRAAGIRNQLFCFSLEYIEGIIAAKAETTRPEGLSGRDWELWQPVLVLARFLDSFNEENNLYNRMVTMAIERRNYKQTLEEDLNPQQQILTAIYQFVNDTHQPTDGFYNGLDLRHSIQEELGWEKLPTDKQLSHRIFEELHIAKSRALDKERRPIGTRKTGFYRLDKISIEERARTMFGVELAKAKDSDLFDED